VLHLSVELLHVHPLAGSVAGYIVAMTWNYTINRVWTFRAGGAPILSSYGRYAMGTLAGFGVRMGTQALLMPHIPYQLAAASGIALGTVFNFAASQYWALRKAR